VIDAGRVSDAEKFDWLAAADLLCLPSLGEIFPVAILEAWSAGTAVLVSDIPPLLELIDTVRAGRAAPRTPAAIAAALEAMLADPDELRAMGERGRAWWSANATPQAVACSHLALYRELLDGATR
jgi:glycosyltransferase involved in cell wall biosynthesis